LQDGLYEGATDAIVVDITNVVNGLENGTQQVIATITDTTPQPPIAWPVGTNPSTGQPWKPGDPYQLVFVTSTTVSGSSPNLSTYNTFVNSVAATSTLPGVSNLLWRAIASALNQIPAIPARTNAMVSAPVYLVDGTTLVATGYSDLWDGSILNPINKDQNGADVVSGTQVWTGCANADGTPANFPTGPFYRCLGSTVAYAQFGLVGSTDSQWINSGELPFGNANRMYAVSGVLTVPPPSNVVIPSGALTVDLGVGVAVLTLANSTAGYEYRLVYKNSLTDADWQPIEGPGGGWVAGGSSIIWVDDAWMDSNPDTPVPARFYRLEAR
jgi:hypothetical protein